MVMIARATSNVEPLMMTIGSSSGIYIYSNVLYIYIYIIMG